MHLVYIPYFYVFTTVSLQLIPIIDPLKGLKGKIKGTGH